MPVVWGIRETGDAKPVVSLFFGQWDTPGEAINAVCAPRGKTWDDLQAEGAQLTRRLVVERQKKPHDCPPLRP